MTAKFNTLEEKLIEVQMWQTSAESYQSDWQELSPIVEKLVRFAQSIRIQGNKAVLTQLERQ
jgi:hypothetical protein